MRTLIVKIIKLCILCYKDAKSDIMWDEYLQHKAMEQKAEYLKREINIDELIKGKEK